MKTVEVKFKKDGKPVLPVGNVNHAKLDATTEADIAIQQKADDADALMDAAKFAKRVRMRVGLSQSEFSQKIDVSVETIRNWEQGKRSPNGAAKALLKILDRSPELALSALG
jgi:putative transcriptional regulator